MSVINLIDSYLGTIFNIVLVSKFPAGCSSRMASLGGWCFHLSQTRMPWASARMACQAFGGQLSSITSAEEDLIVTQLAREAKSAVWTGGCQRSSRAGWKWEDGNRWRFTRFHQVHQVPPGGGSQVGRAVRSTQGAPGESLLRGAASLSPSQAGR